MIEKSNSLLFFTSFKSSKTKGGTNKETSLFCSSNSLIERAEGLSLSKESSYDPSRFIVKNSTELSTAFKYSMARMLLGEEVAAAVSSPYHSPGRFPPL